MRLRAVAQAAERLGGRNVRRQRQHIAGPDEPENLPAELHIDAQRFLEVATFADAARHERQHLPKGGLQAFQDRGGFERKIARLAMNGGTAGRLPLDNL
ncbi:MAG: hypothetical protein QM754_00430 [Tepidisphaeraceae bacterium]